MSNETRLSDRWTHEEHETLTRQADRMNFGDISSWQPGNTWFRRPEVATPKHEPKPIHSLAALRNPSKAKQVNESAKVCAVGSLVTDHEGKLKAHLQKVAFAVPQIVKAHESFYKGKRKTPRAVRLREAEELKQAKAQAKAKADKLKAEREARLAYANAFFGGKL